MKLVTHGHRTSVPAYPRMRDFNVLKITIRFCPRTGGCPPKTSITVQSMCYEFGSRYRVSVSVNEPLRNWKSQHKDGEKQLKVHLNKRKRHRFRSLVMRYFALNGEKIKISFAFDQCK